MESIISDLGVREFPRIRLGISPDDVTRDEHVDYLLTPLSGEKLTLFEEAAELGGEAALDAVAMGFARAMNSYNRLAREKARGDKDRD